uniref:CG5272-PA n=1 Tax=Drosophila ananassae TaxID=7217 RepID=D1GYI4_DROAN|nr:CG5272-PA [Drosophila ananassae]
MERYNRVWGGNFENFNKKCCKILIIVIFADPGSPLAPLTPLTSQAFSFDSVDDDVTPTGVGRSNTASRTALFRGLKSSHLQVPNRRHPGQGTTNRSLPGSTEPTRYSQAFMRTRSVFSPSGQNTHNGTSGSTSSTSISLDPQSREVRAAKIKQEILQGSRQTVTVKNDLSWLKKGSSSRKKESTMSPNPSSTYRRFKHSSPVEHPTLSPRVRSLLDRTGNEHLTELFTRQEIDLEVLIQLTLEDLKALGVRGAREVKIAMQIIQLAKQFFKA